ncbi:MAG: sn-glycerol-3-phosphate ABC transporter ATP-binding protein UgpC [Nitriliruptoraceae bacterium]
MAGITFEDVQKIYPDGTQAVFDLDLEINDHEFMIFVGPSGCGKSTALRMVAGLEEISGGKISIGGRVVNDLSPKDRDVAMVFQSYALYPHMTVAQNMAFALKLAKVEKSEIDKRVDHAAEILGLTDYMHRKPRALSGGQRQRVAMGRAIVRSPQLYLLDEPLSNLDAKLRVQMRGEISSLQRRLGVTTLYVTHDQVEAMTMGDRVAVLKLGRLQQVDEPQKLYEHPVNLFVAGFLGSPPMNIAQGTIGSTDGRLEVTLDDGATTFPIGDVSRKKYPGVANHVGETVAVGIRPEHLVAPDKIDRAAVWTDREVELVEVLGAEMLVRFKTKSSPVISEDIKAAIDDDEAFADLQKQAAKGGQPFIYRAAPGTPPSVGDRIDVGVDVDQFYFFDIETGEALL